MSAVTDSVSMTDSVEATVIRRWPRFFMSSSSHDLALVHKLSSFLESVDVEVIRWDKGVFSAGRSILETFDSELSNIDAAIVLFESDSPSPNIGMESTR